MSNRDKGIIEKPKKNINIKKLDQKSIKDYLRTPFDIEELDLNQLINLKRLAEQAKKDKKKA